MLYAMFDFVAGIDPIGLLVQNGTLFSIPSNALFSVLLEIVTVIFEPIAIYYVFQAYKEFKGAKMDSTGGVGGGDMMGLGGGGGVMG